MIDEDLKLLRKLVAMGEALAESRSTSLSDAAIRSLRAEVHDNLARPRDSVRLIRTEAVCLVEYMIELTYAREDRSAEREGRMIALINALLGFVREDLAAAERSEVLQ